MYRVEWVGMLRTRYLQGFLPGGVPRWGDESSAKLYDKIEDADSAAKTALRGMHRMGIDNVTIEVGSM